MEQVVLNVKSGMVTPGSVPAGIQVVVNNFDGHFSPEDPTVIRDTMGTYKREVFVNPADVPESNPDQLELPFEA